MEPKQEKKLYERTEIWIGVVIIIIAVIAFIIGHHKSTSATTDGDYTSTSTDVMTSGATTDTSVGFDIENRSYVLPSRTVTLADGVEGASSTRPNAVLLEGTAFGYINGDNLKDVAVIIRDEPAGTQDMNYYLVGILGSGMDATTTNAVLLGDAVRIKEVELMKNEIEVIVLERNPGEALTVVPTVPKALFFTISGTTLSSINN